MQGSPRRHRSARARLGEASEGLCARRPILAGFVPFLGHNSLRLQLLRNELRERWRDAKVPLARRRAH
eukprot:1081005-Pyramimonas_sp.AAC.1